jgi:hypothetical protein
LKFAQDFAIGPIPCKKCWGSGQCLLHSGSVGEPGLAGHLSPLSKAHTLFWNTLFRPSKPRRAYSSPQNVGGIGPDPRGQPGSGPMAITCRVLPRRRATRFGYWNSKFGNRNYAPRFAHRAPHLDFDIGISFDI